MIKKRIVERMMRHAAGQVKYEAEVFEDGHPAGYVRKVITDGEAKQLKRKGSWNVLNEEKGGNEYKVLHRITEEEYEPFPGYVRGIARRNKGGSGLSMADRAKKI